MFILFIVMILVLWEVVRNYSPIQAISPHSGIEQAFTTAVMIPATMPRCIVDCRTFNERYPVGTFLWMTGFLPTLKDANDQEKRQAMFRNFDTIGRGKLSYNQVDVTSNSFSLVSGFRLFTMCNEYDRLELHPCSIGTLTCDDS